MPIRAERRALYPPDWTARRARVLERAKNRCEFPTAAGDRCSAPNGHQVARLLADLEAWYPWDYADAYLEPGLYRLVGIVLTIAHLDHDETNSADENLRAGCQLHHLRHDIGQHARSRRLVRGLELPFEL